MGVGVFLLVVGVLAVVFCKFANLSDKFVKTACFVGGATLATIGLMLSLSSLYLAYTPWFYWFAFAKGLLLVTLAKLAGIEKLFWPGIGLLLCAFLMLIIVPGWFLFLLLLGIIGISYYLYTNNNQVKNTVDETLNSLKVK